MLKPSAFLNRFLLVTLGLVISAGQAESQVIALYDVIYRPPGVTYRVHQSGNQEVIYQDGMQVQALETLKVLRQTNPETGNLLGIDPDFRFSIVLNDFSDSGNGYVTPFPFKSEIESVALRGRGLSRQHTSWAQIVTTHEMVHAAQAQYSKPRSVTGLIRFFSPDFARAIGLFVPPGFTEGLAVYRESQVPPEAGRLNHSFFVMQARAGINEGWTLSQMLEAPSYTRPFDRFYKGGSLFVEFFIETYGIEGLQRVMDWQQHLPIAGFGANLRYAVKRSPGEISDSFDDWYEDREQALVSSIGPLSPAMSISRRTGHIHRRPKWTSDSTFVAFAFGYNMKRGFHAYSYAGREGRISTNEIADDAVYFKDTRSWEVLYARYEEHALTSSAKTSSVFSLDLRTGKETRIPESAHAYNPIRLQDGSTFAIRSEGQYNEIVEIGDNSGQRSVLSFEKSDFVSMEPRPGSDSLAVILNVKGEQAVFLADTSKETWSLTPWIGFRGSTIFDGSWDDSGRYFSFTSDRTGILNVYVLDAWSERISRVTNALYAAMEGHVSPDGSNVVYVEYQDERFDMMVTSLVGPPVEAVNRDDANYTWTTDWSASLSESSEFEGDPSADAGLQDERYNPWTRVKPRMLYPTAYLDTARNIDADARLGFGIGVGLQGTDPLQKLAYHAEGILQKNRLWGEVGIQSGQIAVRPSVTLSRRPETVNAIIRGTNTQQRLVRDRTSLDFSAFLPYTINKNVSRTSVVTALSLSRRSTRFLDDDLEVIQDWSRQTSLLPSAFLGRRVTRNPRDLIPTSGQTLRWFGDFELSNSTGENRWAWALLGNVYVPLLQRFNTGIKLDVGVLQQNDPSVFALTFFKPVGWDHAFLNDDTFVRYGARVIQPILFPDKGWVNLPVYLKTVYLFGFAHHLPRDSELGGNISSVGGGLGVKLRLLHHFDFDLNFTSAYRIQTKEWETIWDLFEEQ